MNVTEIEESLTPALQPVVRARKQYRVSNWLNTNTGEPVYGIQRNTEKGKWVNCAGDGEALLYTKKETAEKHCRWLNDPKGTEPEWSKDSAL